MIDLVKVLAVSLLQVQLFAVTPHPPFLFALTAPSILQAGPPKLAYNTMIFTDSFLWLRLFATIYFIRTVRSELAVTWICPSAVDRYEPGDVMLVRWVTSHDITSPIFRLCSSRAEFATRFQDEHGESYDSCGSAVHSVVDTSAGSYFTSLGVPNTTHESTFYLVMQNAAEQASSPSFRISPSAVTVAVASDQPISSSYDPSASPSPSHLETQPPPHGSVAPTAPFGSFAPSSSEMPYLSVAHMPPPTAAYAVPLSFVGAILLAAIVLAVRHHQQVKNEWAENAGKINPSRSSSVSTRYSTSCGQRDPKRASDTLYTTYTLHHNLPSPDPPFNTFRPEVRSQTRQAFPATYFARIPTAGRESPRPALATPVGPPSRCLTPSRPGVQANAESANVSVTNLVLSDYNLPTMILSPTRLTPPDRLHIRDQADTSPSYFSTDAHIHHGEVRSLQNPIRAGGSGIYDVVAYTGSDDQESRDMLQRM